MGIKTSKFALYLRSLRAFSFPVSTGAVVAATAIDGPVASWRWDVLVASVAAVAAYHGFGNLLNDYCDYKSGADRRLDGDDGRPGRLLVKGLMTPREVLAQAFVCLGVAIVLSLWILYLSGLVIIVFAVLAALAGWSYTAEPLCLKRRGLGELLVAIVYGPLLMAGAAYAQYGSVSPRLLILSISPALAVAGILLANNIRDMDEDAAGDIRTLAVRIGFDKSVKLYAAIVCIAALLPAVLAGFGHVSRWLMLSPLLIASLGGVLKAHIHQRRMADVDVRNAKFTTLLLLALTVAQVFWWR